MLAFAPFVYQYDGMERKPEHRAEDPSLRAQYTEQMSLDEWARENAPILIHPYGRLLVEHEMRIRGIEATFEDALHAARAEWLDTLHPETSVGEFYYLQGYSHCQRLQIIDQHCADLNMQAREMGFITERPEDEEFRKQFGT